MKTSVHQNISKQKISAEKRTIEKKQKQFYWKVCNVLGNIFHCIRKYFIMWDVQYHNITWRSRNDLEKQVSNRLEKQEHAVFLAATIALK